MTNIKKRCHNCDTPLTINPKAASVPGELCRLCHDDKDRINKTYCSMCKKELTKSDTRVLSFTTSDTTNNEVYTSTLCESCHSKVISPRLDSITIMGVGAKFE